MSITFQSLSDELPPGTIEFVGNNQLKLNFSQLTGDNLTLESSCVQAIVKLLQSLASLTQKINLSREEATPPLPAIDFASSLLNGTPQQPKYEFTIKVKVDNSQFINNLVDPTVE